MPVRLAYPTTRTPKYHIVIDNEKGKKLGVSAADLPKSAKKKYLLETVKIRLKPTIFELTDK